MAFKLLNKTVIKKCLRRHFSTSNSDKIKTAGIIVIGDEILKGEVADTNSTFLAIELHNLGLQLKKISVIGDNVEEVSEEVRYYSKSFDYVLTTGGIGPTHDDVTYEGVAMAFQQELILHPELREICERFYKTSDTNHPGMKLARIPKSSKLNFNSEIKGVKMAYPMVSVNNVYLFPGIPELLTKSFNNLKEILFISNKKFYSKCMFFNITEDKIAETLHVLVKEFPDVQFGSYPKLFHREYKVKVTIESYSEESTLKAHVRLQMLIPKEYIVDVEDI